VRFLYRVFLAVSALLGWASSVAAQTAPASEAAPAPPPLVAPVVLGSTEVPYPAGATGDAVVVLELVVAKDGTVSRATVIDGAEPFAERARTTVLTWRFSPARRGDVPVAARIRARVDFKQRDDAPDANAASRPAASATDADGGAAPPPSAGSGHTEAIEEVVVHGKRREIGQMTLSANDVREMPGAFGDPFRAIEVLPSVTPVVSGLPFFYIRGAPPNDNGYFIDGIRVPLLFHVGIGEGVIHPGLVDHVDFFPGAAPAAYGGYAGAIIAGQTREPATARHGEANVRLIDAGALVESPFDDGRGSALVAGRYGYPGPIISAVTPTVRLGYWDYQTRATFELDERGDNAIGVFAFGSHDYIGTASTKNGVTGPIKTDLASDFHRVDLRWDRALGEGHLRVAATLGYDSQGGAGESGTALTTVENLNAAVRAELEERLSASARVRGGIDAHVDKYGFAQGEAPLDPSGEARPQVPSSADPPPTNFTGAAHADVVWRVAPRVELVPGARFDVFSSTRANGASGANVTTTVPAFDPRLAARVTLAPKVAWLSTFGLSHQYPSLRVGAVPALIISVPGFPTGSSELQSVAQASQGIEVALPADFTLTTTGFLSGWSGLTDLTASCIQIMPAFQPPSGPGSPPPAQPPYVCPSNAPVHGRAYGVEVLLRRPLSKRLSGWLSYTLSRSTREEHFVTPTGGDAVATVASDYDRTHVLNAIVTYELGWRWRAGARFVFFTGTPYSNLAGNVPVPPYNDQRDPPFFRLDVRFEKRWTLGKSGSLAFVAEVQNATLSKEVTPFGLSCRGEATDQGQTTQCTHASVGPITIPSLGVEGSL
jgi:TonB family protein